jgi:sarcosine oxidase/L-pipecolate oxidase
MHGSNLATGQVLAFLKLEENEIERLKNMPIYMNFDSGWFCFPPHQRTGRLKMAIHGHGYTRTESIVPKTDGPSPMGKISTPPTTPLIKRTNFAPGDAVERLRSGLKEILPEMATRAFDQVSVCWYSETPTGDFILDYHPEFSNLFLATGGSGQ